MPKISDLPKRQKCLHCERTAQVINRCHACDMRWRRNRVRLLCRWTSHRYNQIGFCTGCNRARV